MPQGSESLAAGAVEQVRRLGRETQVHGLAFGQRCDGGVGLELGALVAESVVLTAINTRVIGPRDFVRAGDAVNLSAAGRKRFFTAYEQRLNATIVHPVFDYQVSYRRALELQARLLAKALTGEIEQYVPFTTR